MRVLKPGQGREHPMGDDCLKLAFTGWKRDGSVVTTSHTQGDGVIQCLHDVVPGVAEALRSMVVGESRRAWLPAALTAPIRPSERASTLEDLTFDLEILQLTRAPTLPKDLKTPSQAARKLPSGLALLVLKKGSGTSHPVSTSRVTVHLSGWKADGALIESTPMAQRPVVYPVVELIAGMREGLLRMTVGEKTRFWIPAALAYGDTPGRRGVPTGALVYDIELLAID